MKNYDVYLTPETIKDLTEIYEYITEKSNLPEVAWAYIEKLRLNCHSLKTAPLIGQKRMIYARTLELFPLIITLLQPLRLMEKNKSSSFLVSFMAAENMER